jgi:hypothetical protein
MAGRPSSRKAAKQWAWTGQLLQLVRPPCKAVHTAQTDLSHAAESRKLSEKIKKKGGAKLEPVTNNLVDAVWQGDRPARPNEKVIILDTKYSGKKFEEKLEDLRKELDKKKSAGIVICTAISRGIVRIYTDCYSYAG